MASQPQEAAMKGFQLLLFSILLSFQGMQVKATEAFSTHQEEREKETDMSAGSEEWIGAGLVLPSRQQQQQAHGEWLP